MSFSPSTAGGSMMAIRPPRGLWLGRRRRPYGRRRPGRFRWPPSPTRGGTRGALGSRDRDRSVQPRGVAVVDESAPAPDLDPDPVAADGQPHAVHVVRALDDRALAGDGDRRRAVG